ncbi:MAG: TonB-dependent receptor [Myxococcota bacterium]|nr:TonB-dependent receptor [Myxococcota bacterium]
MKPLNKTSRFALLCIYLIGVTPASLAAKQVQEDAPAIAEDVQPSSEPQAEPVVSEDDPDIANDGFVLPVLKKAVSAPYPEAALQAGIETDVVMEIDIDVQGKVEAVNVLVPADPPGYGFDEAAVAAAWQFEFEPGLDGDTPVPVRITYRYRFELTAAALQAPEPDTPVGDTATPSTPPEVAAPATVNFIGELRERGTRLPLVGVTVTVFRSKGDEAVGFEATTDKAGRFEFKDLALGQWKVLARPEGYFPLRSEETIAPNELTQARYYVERSDYNPYDVLVEGETTRKEVSRTSLTVEEAERIPGTFGDVLKAVQNLPGVARSGPLSGNIIVRGSSPEDSEIFVEGVSVPIIYHFGGTRSVIPVGMLDRIDFYPGNFSVRYGRATGGIVDVGLARLDPPSATGYIDVNLFDAGAFLSVPLTEKTAVAVAARRSYIDTFIESFVPSDAPVNLIAAPRYYDYQFLFSTRPSAAHELKLFFFGSSDKLKVLFDNPADINPELRARDASTSTEFYRTLIEYTFVPNDTIKNVFKTSAGRNWIFFGLGDQLFLDINSYVAQIRDTFTWQPTDRFTLTAGADYLFNRADTRIKFPPPPKEGELGGRPDLDTIRFTANDGDDFHSLAAFIELEGLFFNRLLVIPGIRFDYFSLVGEVAYAPRLVARLMLSDQWTLKAGIGRFFQEPSFDEVDEVFGNPDLGLESAIHYSAGVEYRPFGHLTLDVTGFYKVLDNLVSRTSQTLERDGETQPLNFNNGARGRVYGLEVLLRHDFHQNLSGWISYTLSRAERRDYGAKNYRLFDFDQTHILSVLGTYALPRNWSIGLRWRLVSGNPQTARVGSVYVVDDGTYEAISGTPNASRLPRFHQLDLRIDKRWIFDTFMLTAYLDLQNAYNRANPVGTTYNYDFTEKGVQQSLPIIPILGIKGEF